LRVSHRDPLHPPRNLAEQVAALQLEVVFVDEGHGEGVRVFRCSGVQASNSNSNSNSNSVVDRLPRSSASSSSMETLSTLPGAAFPPIPPPHPSAGFPPADQ